MHTSNLVYLNYYTDPSRRPAMVHRLDRELAPLGYRVATELTAEDCRAVRLLVNKTREIADADLQRFPNLHGIILWGTEKWMLSYDEAARPLDIRRLDVDRGVEVAEHALALLLAGIKCLHRLRPWRRLLSPRQLYQTLFPRVATESVGAHNWTQAQTGSLYRKKVGIVGYGLIARQIHRRLEGFSCQVYYHHSRRYSACVEQRLGISYLDVPELFAECDAVFAQLPLTPATENLIRRDSLERAKPGLALVNCGRASVVNEEDLYRALRGGRIGFYGADVFWHEPVAPWNRFCRLPNVLITPHLAESALEPPDFLGMIIQQIGTCSGRPSWTRAV